LKPKLPKFRSSLRPDKRPKSPIQAEKFPTNIKAVITFHTYVVIFLGMKNDNA